MRQALAAFGPDAICRLLARNGVTTYAAPDGSVFPVSERAGDVLKVLVKNTAQYRMGCRVSAVVPMQNGFTVETDQGPVTCGNVILAAGGKSYSGLGSDGSGFAVAERLGIRIVKPVPALAGLTVAEKRVTELSGNVLERAVVRFGRSSAKGEVLFTHKGVSGPAVLALSGEVNAAGRGVIELGFDADKTPGYWAELLNRWRGLGTRKVVNELGLLMPKRLAEFYCAEAGIGEEVCARLSNPMREKLIAVLTALNLTVTGSEGWDRAMVTRGGIDLSEIDPRRMEIKKIPGLFCAGEIVDLDGPCGGYNITWALASGHCAGTAALEQRSGE